MPMLDRFVAGVRESQRAYTADMKFRKDFFDDQLTKKKFSYEVYQHTIHHKGMSNEDFLRKIFERWQLYDKEIDSLREIHYNDCVSRTDQHKKELRELVASLNKSLGII